MQPAACNESTVEAAALSWFEELGYGIGHGPNFAPGEPAADEVIEELIRLAKEMREANRRGEQFGLNDDEAAFYDTLGQNESAVRAMGSDEFKVIAAELVTQVRRSVTIDWTLRESARAKIRVLVRRILRKYGYPPDLQEEATRTVLEQAEAMCAEWAG